MLPALGFLAMTAGALAFRLPQLALRPMHCDEANQALKAAILLETGRYEYDPQEHHGPLLYYATLPSLRLGGVKDFVHSREIDYRLVPVLFGAGLILLIIGLGVNAAARVLVHRAAGERLGHSTVMVA